VHTISRNKKGNIALQAASQINMYASGERERRREREREREKERGGGGDFLCYRRALLLRLRDAFSPDLIPDVDKMRLPRARIIVM